MRWVVGDIQGCAREFEELLETIRFDRSRDELWSVGDLINRGPDPLAVLELWRDVGGKAVIGNHEIGVLLTPTEDRPRRFPTLDGLLASPDLDGWLATLRDLPVLVYLGSEGAGPDAWIVHAGLDPRWRDLETVAERVNPLPHDESWLRNEDVQFATRVRCCTAEGERDRFTGPPEDCPPPFRPWDEFYQGETLVVHGHWAQRGHYRTRNVLGLDSGCVYGGALTAWCQEDDRIVQVPSRQ
ncbi:MAG: metallophosphoesterase [Acidobacteriota bacterium]|nr:metallophosphoesterase [Acidobacteriota bacterium]